MRKILLLLLFLTVSVWADDLKGKPDKSAPAGWLRYSFGSRPALSITMPGKPKKQTLGAATGIKSINLYVSSKGTVVTLIESIEFSTSAETPGFRQNFFPEAFSSFKSSYEKTSGMKLKVSGRKPVQFGKMTGFEMNYDNPKVLGRVRLVLQDKRGFLMSAFVPKNSARLLDQFVQSAQLIP